MEARTEYIFHHHEEDIVEEDDVGSSMSDEEKKEYGFINYQDDSSDSGDETPIPRRNTRREMDFDIKDIRVEFSKREPPPLLSGTILSNLPYSPRPPSHSPRRNSISSTSTDTPYIQPYYEERGELSGHFEPGRLSSDFVAKPHSLISSRRSSHVTFRHDSSNDSGVSSQATSNRTPISSDGYHDSQEDFVDMTDDAYEEYMYSLEKYGAGSRSSSQSTHRGRRKVRLKSAHHKRTTPEFTRQESDNSLPTYSSTLDSFEDISGNLEDLGSFTNSNGRRSSNASSVSVAKPQSGRMMTRKKFHRGYYIRARYPAQMHSDKFAKQKEMFKPPPSLCPPSRYGKEAKILKVKQTSTKPKKWPEPPRYPPKARHASTECEILRLVETLDLGIQCNPDMEESSAQCTATMTDSSTQYPKIRRKNCGIQTVEKTYSDFGVQNSVETRSRMVETSHRILYYPMANTANAKIQCDNVSCDVQTDAAEAEGNRGAIKKVLNRQDTIDRIKQQNKLSSESDNGSQLKSDTVTVQDKYFKSGNHIQTEVLHDNIEEEKKKAQAEGMWNMTSKSHTSLVKCELDRSKNSFTKSGLQDISTRSTHSIGASKNRSTSTQSLAASSQCENVSTHSLVCSNQYDSVSNHSLPVSTCGSLTKHLSSQLNRSDSISNHSYAGSVRSNSSLNNSHNELTRCSTISNHSVLSVKKSNSASSLAGSDRCDSASNHSIAGSDRCDSARSHQTNYSRCSSIESVQRIKSRTSSYDNDDFDSYQSNSSDNNDEPESCQ